MKLSVVILNYNVRYFLEQCILSVQRATNGIDSEIIIVDNNSSDDSCAMVREKFPELQLIQNNENLGFSKANNQAVKEAKGDYVCILNPDIAVSEDTFIKSLNFAKTQENLGALGVYLMDGTGNFLPESKRNVPTRRASLLKILGFSKKYYSQHVKEDETGDVSVLVGAYMLMKRTVYEEVGGFDEDYFMYGEDIDLSYKIEKAGYKNKYFGSTEILHYKGESTQRDGVYLNRFYGAMRIFYRKHFPSNLLLSFVVNIGVGLVKWKNAMIPSERGTPGPHVKEAIVFTENLNLYRALSEVIDIELKPASKAILMDQIIRDTMLIFDVEYMSYGQIFSIMKRNKNRNNMFRIRPPKCNFIVGSDKSNEKGSVVVF